MSVLFMCAVMHVCCSSSLALLTPEDAVEDAALSSGPGPRLSEPLHWLSNEELHHTQPVWI